MIARLCVVAVMALILLAPDAGFAQVAKFGGTWRAVVLRKKKDRVSLTKDGATLLIVIHQQAKTWEASSKSGTSEQKTSGTFQIEGEHVVFAQSDGRKHTLKLLVNGDELVIIPKDDPDTRLVAQRVR